MQRSVITWSGHNIRRVSRCVVKGDILPDFESNTQRGTPPGCFLKHLRPFIHDVTSLIARLNHGFYGHTVGRCTGSDTHRMTNGTATELEYHDFIQIVQPMVHLSSMNTTRGHAHDRRL